MGSISDQLRRARDFAGREVWPNFAAFVGSRQPLVWLVAVAIGIAVAYAIIAFRLAIALVQLPWLGSLSEKVATMAAAQPAWIVILAPAAGGLVVGIMLQHLMPLKRPEVVADVIEARALHGARIPLRSGMGSAVIAAISLGSGASAGREGPAVHLGATLASALAQRLKLPVASRRALLGAGAAAAVSASFNAPIAGALFALEVVLGHYAVRAFIPIVISSVGATLVARYHLGDFPAFTVTPYEIRSLLEFPAFALLGLVCGLVAICFQLSVAYADWFAHRISCPLWLRPVVGGLLVGLIGVNIPEILGVGYEATDTAIRGQYGLMMLLTLLFAKTLATAITLASGLGGGGFSPTLYLGAMAGGAFGLMAGVALPEFASHHGLYSIVGMGAVSAAILGAPISTTLIAFELTGGYALTIALLLAVSISVGLMQAVLGRSFFHWQLGSRGLVLHEGPHRQLMRTIRVRDVMTPLAPDEAGTATVAAGEEALRPGDTLEAALRAFDAGGFERLPVIDDEQNRRLLGNAERTAVIDAFNKALIEATVEEHK